MPFMLPSQQCQSTDGTVSETTTAASLVVCDNAVCIVGKQQL